MIIHKNLKNFLEIIENADLNLQPICEHDLRKKFKNNEYYNLIKFCLLNEIIFIEYSKIYLTSTGKNLFTFLKNCKNL